MQLEMSGRTNGTGQFLLLLIYILTYLILIVPHIKPLTLEYMCVLKS